MKNAFLGSIIFLIVILAVGLYLAPFIRQIEGFKTSILGSTEGTYPISVNRALLDDYPQIGKNETSNDNYSDIWTNYTVFSLGSFKQITNNLRYHNNPDNGQCIRADFCGALYNNKKTQSNIVNPLPPAEEGLGARVGYFRSDPNELYFSIPTNENILY
jgi:hypothetical protein